MDQPPYSNAILEPITRSNPIPSHHLTPSHPTENLIPTNKTYNTDHNIRICSSNLIQTSRPDTHPRHHPRAGKSTCTCTCIPHAQPSSACRVTQPTDTPTLTNSATSLSRPPAFHVPLPTGSDQQINKARHSVAHLIIFQMKRKEKHNGSKRSCIIIN